MAATFHWHQVEFEPDLDFLFRLSSITIVMQTKEGVRLSCPDDYISLLENFDTWMFDCDGVLWRGTHLVEGARDVIALLRSRREMLFFLDHLMKA
jgi:hypothetical protein